MRPRLLFAFWESVVRFLISTYARFPCECSYIVKVLSNLRRLVLYEEALERRVLEVVRRGQRGGRIPHDVSAEEQNEAER